MKHTIRIFFLTVLPVVMMTACAFPSPVVDSVPQPSAPPNAVPETQVLTVFAAASLTNAFIEIGERFQAENPNVTITFNFAGSQALQTQIMEGAPADVFVSASTMEMDVLVDAALIAPGAPQIFLSNKLVVVVPADNPARIHSVEDLANPGVKIVIAAEEVPVGRYTREALEKMNDPFGSGFRQQALANVVSNENNARQALTKIQFGEADAGIVYLSDAVTAPELQMIDIPAELNVTATYLIAPLVESGNAELAQTFIAYMLSADGQSILQKWGFTPLQ